MADSMVTFRPDGTPEAASWTVGGGAGSLEAAVSDDSDSTYADGSASPAGPAILTFDLSTFAIGGGSQVRAVVPRVRMSQPTGAQAFNVFLADPSGNGPGTVLSPSASITTFTLPPRTKTAIGAAWTQADLDAMQIKMGVFGASSGNFRVMEVYVDLYFNVPPVVTPTGPTGSVTDTATPAVTWTYADSEGDAQERYRIKVFPASVYGAGGFDPETSSGASWDSGEVASPNTTVVVTQELLSGFTYRAYIKAADDGSGGRYGSWVYTQWTQAVDDPAVPAISVTPDPPNAKIDVSVRGSDNLLSANQAGVETDVTGLLAKDNCTIARSTAQAAQGAASLAITAGAPGAGDTRAITSEGTAGVPVVPGATYIAMANFRAGATARTVEVWLRWYDSAGTEISTTAAGTATDSSSDFNAQASVTGTAPPGAAYASMLFGWAVTAGGEVHYVDKLKIAPGTSAQWTRGGLVPTHAPAVERSDDGGATWTALARSGATGVFEPQLWIYADWEAPRGAATEYRARMTAKPASLAVASAYSATATATLAAVGEWLKDPLDHTASVSVCLEAPQTSTSQEGQVVSEPLDRPDYVVQGDIVRGEVLPLAFTFETDAEWAAFESLRKSQAVLLVQTLWGDGTGAAPYEQFYARLGDTRSVTRYQRDGSSHQLRAVSISARQVARPG